MKQEQMKTGLKVVIARKQGNKDNFHWSADMDSFLGKEAIIASISEDDPSICTLSDPIGIMDFAFWEFHCEWLDFYCPSYCSACGGSNKHKLMCPIIMPKKKRNGLLRR